MAKEPSFNEISNGFQVILYNKKVVNTKKVPDNLSENLKKIIIEIQNNNKVSMVDLSKTISISKRKILDNINKLKEFGLLERVGNNKTGYWRLIKK